ncbi:MAG: DUF4442 domain-containing protein [Flavobacterium sp.]|nr:DUF4442 domain-containing protein [Candidatus Neoflavobacterium equi]
MKLTPSNLNKYTMYKLPSAYFSGVRVKDLQTKSCEVTVGLNWFNKNPFKSMYFAVQAMAAELSTGALLMYQIQKLDKDISMLVAQNNSTYTKKAVGKITFTCVDGFAIEEAVAKAAFSGEGETIWVKSIGVDEKGDQVSEFNFLWTLKLKTKKK